MEQEIEVYMRGGSLNPARGLADIVNVIRQDATVFKVWQGSDAAKLVTPPVFRNKKNSAGYFILPVYKEGVPF